jgi:hypothetical protein
MEKFNNEQINSNKAYHNLYLDNAEVAYIGTRFTREQFEREPKKCLQEARVAIAYAKSRGLSTMQVIQAMLGGRPPQPKTVPSHQTPPNTGPKIVPRSQKSSGDLVISSAQAAAVSCKAAAMVEYAFDGANFLIYEVQCISSSQLFIINSQDKTSNLYHLKQSEAYNKVLKALGYADLFTHLDGFKALQRAVLGSHPLTSKYCPPCLLIFRTGAATLNWQLSNAEWDKIAAFCYEHGAVILKGTGAAGSANKIFANFDRAGMETFMKSTIIMVWSIEDVKLLVKEKYKNLSHYKERYETKRDLHFLHLKQTQGDLFDRKQMDVTTLSTSYLDLAPVAFDTGKSNYRDAVFNGLGYFSLLKEIIAGGLSGHGKHSGTPVVQRAYTVEYDPLQNFTYFNDSSGQSFQKTLRINFLKDVMRVIVDWYKKIGLIPSGKTIGAAHIYSCIAGPPVALGDATPGDVFEYNKNLFLSDVDYEAFMNYVKNVSY